MKTIFHTFLFLCFYSITTAQSINESVIANAGSVMSNTSNILNFTIGETFTGTITNTTSIDQGFWSGIASIAILSTEDITLNDASIVIYPNPVSNFFTIQIPDINAYTISLFNDIGQRIMTQKINAAPLGDRIDIRSLSQGMYILSLSVSGTNTTKTFKIIKQ